MYLSFDEYQGYGGTLDETTYNTLYYECKVRIDYYTFNRLQNDTEFTDQVKRCMFRLINLINQYNDYEKLVTNTSAPVVASQSNDGVSISFGGVIGHTSPNDLNAFKEKLDNDIKNCIKLYLYGERNQSGEVLLYRGVR